MEMSSGATGLVWRDSTGKLLRAQALWYANTSNLLIMEANAFRDGVRMAMERGISDVHIETDAQQVVQLWLGHDFERSEVGGILHEVREMSGKFL